MAMQSVATARVDAFLNQLMEAGVPLRVLLRHGLLSLEWLADHATDRFRLARTSEAGEAVQEDVGAVQLLLRAEELGWKPWASTEDEVTHFLCYENALYHEYGGVHWYGTEVDDETCLPAALPERALRAARDRLHRERARVARQRAAAERAQERDSRRFHDSNLRSVLGRMAKRELEHAAANGKPISAQAASRRAKREWSATMAQVQKLSGARA